MKSLDIQMDLTKDVLQEYIKDEEARIEKATDEEVKKLLTNRVASYKSLLASLELEGSENGDG